MGSHILLPRYFVRDVQLFPCCFDPSPTHIQFNTQEGNSFMTVKIIGNGACTLIIKGIFTIGELLLQKSILLLLLITLYCKKFSYDKPWFDHEKLPWEKFKLLRNSSVSQRNPIYRKKKWAGISKEKTHQITSTKIPNCQNVKQILSKPKVQFQA